MNAGNAGYFNESGVVDRLSSSVTDDSGNKLSYTFTVDELTSERVTVTFTKNGK